MCPSSASSYGVTAASWSTSAATHGLSPDALAAHLRAVFAGAGGTHEDWDEFDRVMAAERRTAVLLQPARVYGQGG